MKRNLIQTFIACLLLCFSSLSYAADTFTLDSQHTYLLFHINHFGFSTQSGKWFATGTLVLDKDKPQNSKVIVTIPVASVDTGVKELDDHLRSDLFFDVKQFPVAKFVSDKVDMTGKNTAKVHGILTLHGVSKPLTLDVKFNKSGISLITNKMTVGFTASAKLKRSDFGINTLLPGLNDEVNIDIEAEAFKAS